ncbi:MAG: PEP-CTERM sorting domain-containing protein [Nitrospirales bacterium]
MDPSGNVFSDFKAAPLPEPSTMLLFSSSMVSLFVWRWKQRKKNSIF